MKNKVFVSGKNFLPQERREDLEKELQKKGMREVGEIKDADVAIIVLGGNYKFHASEADKWEKPFFWMRQECDDSEFLCSLSGEAVRTQQAARWAWSMVNEPEKWTFPGKCKHPEVTQLELLRKEYPAVHGPSSEVWQVKCNGCGKVFETNFIGD